MRLTLLSAITLAVLAGCAAPINIRNAEAHAQAGYAAEAHGDWDTARSQFAQAVVNADLGHAEPAGKAQVNYEYGRTLGVTCYWRESEQYLLKSRQLSEQGGLRPYLALYELGLLNERQGKAAEAAGYFAELIPLMEKENLRTQYPLGVADAYERYAVALFATGHAAEAESNRAEAIAIRNANPNAQPFGQVTPYGTVCANTP